LVKKGYLTIGNNPVEVSYRLDGMLCLFCKHFDIKAYERDFIVQKRHFSIDACKSSGVIFDGKGPIACSNFEKK
jgi:hypothetical protein